MFGIKVIVNPEDAEVIVMLAVVDDFVKSISASEALCSSPW